MNFTGVFLPGHDGDDVAVITAAASGVVVVVVVDVVVVVVVSALTSFESSKGDSVLLLFDKVPFLFVAVTLVPGGRKILRNFRIILQDLTWTRNNQID